MAVFERRIRRKTELEDLTDETLIEILVRVPAKAAHRCKCVSKRWLSLISCDYFADNYRRRHKGDDSKTLLLQFSELVPDKDDCSFTLLCGTVHSLHDNHLLSLDFVNQHMISSELSYVSNDLLLITSSDDYHTMFICNPLTKQTFSLPPSPSLMLPLYEDFIRICICSVDSPSLYKVVLVARSCCRDDGFLYIRVFSSDTNNWERFVVPSHPNFVHAQTCVEAEGIYTTTLNGSLYCCTNIIFKYNPFSNPQQCDFIDIPQSAKIDHKNNRKRRGLCITNVGQHLRLYHWIDIEASTQTLSVWDMDTTNHTWSEKHFVDLTSINWPRIKTSMVFMSIKGFNPDDGDVLHVLSLDRQLLAVNLRTKAVQLLVDLNNYPKLSTAISLFPYAPPPWPTPSPREHLLHKRTVIDKEAHSG